MGLPPRPPLRKAEEPDSSTCRCQRVTGCRCTSGLRKGIPSSRAAPRIGPAVGSSAVISSVVIIGTSKPLSTDRGYRFGEGDRSTLRRHVPATTYRQSIPRKPARLALQQALARLAGEQVSRKGRSRLERAHGQVEAPLQARKQQPLQQGRSRRMFRGTCALMAVSSHPTPGSISLRLLEGEGPAVRGWNRLS